MSMAKLNHGQNSSIYTCFVRRYWRFYQFVSGTTIIKYFELFEIEYFEGDPKQYDDRIPYIYGINYHIIYASGNIIHCNDDSRFRTYILIFRS